VQISTQSGKQQNQISKNEHAAIFAIINKSRMLNGWAAKTAQELDATIRVWFDALSAYKIPLKCYDTLYLRAIDTRQTFLSNGKEPPLFNVDLLISCWTGTNGLQSELRAQEIRKGRTLTENAETTCKYCFGTGLRYKLDENGKPGDGIIGKCNHQDG